MVEHHKSLLPNHTDFEELQAVEFDLSLLGWSADELKGLAEDGWASDIEAVEKHGGIPPYAETQNYVKAILG